MSIAEKLTAIAENEQLVANANADLEEVLYSTSEGGKSYYDAFWDAYQKNGKRTNYSNAFGGIGWNDTTFQPKYKMSPTTADGMFAKSDITTITNIDTSKAVTLLNMFSGASLLKSLPKIDASGVTSSTGATGVFASCDELERIEELVLHSGITNYSNMFAYCYKLQHITIGGIINGSIDFRHCPLTKASITSVVNALSATASGNTATFSKAAKEAAFTASEWNTLVATKSNWAFSLI